MNNNPAPASSKAVAQSPKAYDPANPDGQGYLGHDLEATLVADRNNREIVRVFSPFLGEHLVEHSTLRPGGHLCLWVPAVPALFSSDDRSLGHYRRYRKPERSEKLRNAGFEIVQMEYKDFVGMVARFVCCRVLGLGLTPGNVLVYDRMVLPLNTPIGRRLRLPIGKSLLAIARRGVDGASNA